MDINEIIKRSEKNELVKYKNYSSDITGNQSIMSGIEVWAVFQFNLVLIRIDMSDIERIEIDRGIEVVCHGKYLFLLFPRFRKFSIIKNSFTISYHLNGWYIDGTVTGKITQNN